MKKKFIHTNKKLSLISYIAIFTFLSMVFSSIVVYGFAYIGHLIGVWNFGSSPVAALLAVILLGSVVLSTAIVLIFGNHLVLKSIRNVSLASKKVAEGDFDHQLPIPREREIGNLVSNFNNMVEQLKNQEMLANDFISNVSHEFKNPLSAIQGYAQLLDDTNISHEDRVEYVSLISKKTRTLSNLISDILQLSKLDNQSIKLKISNFLLDEQIRHSILMFEKNWEMKNIHFNIDLPETTLCANKYMIGQVWNNLIDNSIKFSNQNGTVSITIYEDKNNVITTISDNGIGMDAVTTSRIFDKFYQKNHSEFKGNGLGLSLVKKIIELHDGKIEVESSLNKGTTFMVILPKSRPSEPQNL